MKHALAALLLLTASAALGQPTLANSDDIAAAKARANHTGTQAHTTITGLGTAATKDLNEYPDEEQAAYSGLTSGDVFLSATTGKMTTLPASVSGRMAYLETRILAMFSGTAGAWYDGRYATTDTAGVTPAAASSNLVARLTDRSGNGKHALQDTSGNRSVWLADGSVNLRGTPGNPRFYQVPLDLTGTTAATVVIAARQTTTSTLRAVVGHGILNSATGGFEVGFNGTGAGQLYTGAGISAATWCYNRGSTGVAGQPRVATVYFNPAGSNLDDKQAIREYGADIDEAQTGSGSITTAMFGNNTLCVGAVTPASNTLGNFDLYGVLLFARALTPVEQAICEEWATLRMPNTTVAGSLAAYADSGPVINDTTHNRTSEFASVTYRTTATAMELGIYNNNTPLASTLYDVGVAVNGKNLTSVGASIGFATQRHVIQLPAGNKTVTLTNSPQTWSNYPTAEPVGNHITAAKFNAAATVENPAPTNRVLIYGDSIASGDAARPIQTSAWAMKLRKHRGNDSTAVEGWGFRSLNQDASDGTKRAAFVARMAAYAPSVIWLAIGTNDYGISSWGHAAFQSAYDSLLSDLNAALPSAVIYAQTPLLRGVETANPAGSTLAQYRAAIAAAASGKSYVTVVDGTTLLGFADLSADQLHPTTEGHHKIFAAIAGILEP